MERKGFSILVLAIVLAILGFSVGFTSAAAENSRSVLTLEGALSQALSANPGIAASRARVDAERSAVRLQYAPANPRIGWMRERPETGAEVMDSWRVSQELMFPTKYFVMGSMQRARADSEEQVAQAKRLEVRRKVLAAYYGLFAAERTLALLEAQRETLREVARIAESRYAAGSVSQQDQMKAHVEQTKIENDYLMAKQERDSMSAMLNALIARDPGEDVALPKGELPLPRLTLAAEDLPRAVRTSSRSVRQGEFMVKEAEKGKSLARWNYAPDFMLSYRRGFQGGSQAMYEVGVELSVPLWFFARQTSEASSAGARLVEAEKRLEQMTRETDAEARSLHAQARSQEKMLKIYETSLVPQASTMLDTSRAAYRAGRASFIELIDSERSLYDVRMAYYRTLAQYVQSLTRLEEVVGTSVSTLPAGGLAGGLEQ